MYVALITSQKPSAPRWASICFCSVYVKSILPNKDIVYHATWRELTYFVLIGYLLIREDLRWHLVALRASDSYLYLRRLHWSIQQFLINQRAKRRKLFAIGMIIGVRGNYKPFFVRSIVVCDIFSFVENLYYFPYRAVEDYISRQDSFPVLFVNVYRAFRFLAEKTQQIFMCGAFVLLSICMCVDCSFLAKTLFQPNHNTKAGPSFRNVSQFCDFFKNSFVAFMRHQWQKKFPALP